MLKQKRPWKLAPCRGLKMPVAGWHCHPEDLGLSGRFMAMVFWKTVWKIGPNSPKYVRTVQDVSGQLKLCPDSPKCDSSEFVQTAQNMSGQPKICPDSSRCVRTVQDVSDQFKMCPDGNSLVYGIWKILWWKISSYMLKNQHRYDEISADRSIPNPL